MRNRVIECIAIGGIVMIAGISAVGAQNQTSDVSPVLLEDTLPFRISIELADFSLPSGLQSYVAGTSGGRWLMLAGRINGLHGFNNDDSNFPPNQQNTMVFVVDPVQQTVVTRSLADPGAGLSQAQIDLLSVTSAQSYQRGRTLYISGGYGIDTAAATFSTKDALTAIDVPALMQWVVNPPPGDTAAQHIRQIHDPIFQVTGGQMRLGANGVTLLMFGQDFVGANVISANGTYTEQVRRMRIVDDAVALSVVPLVALPAVPDANYRRRDLNIVPTMRNGADAGWTALSGVFTPGNGVWTVPVDIASDGTPSMADPSSAATFKQAMNGYVSANFGAYSADTDRMYTVLLGGISYGYFAGGALVTDAELPFINQVTTVLHGANGTDSQYLMSAEYPLIASTGSNPGNALLFGSAAHVFATAGLPRYANGVLDLDLIGTQPRIVGYIVGGIMSTLPNTVTQSDTAASPTIFKVTLTSLRTPVVVQARPVPMLSPWELLAFALLVGAMGTASLRAGNMKIGSPPRT
ncbi:MAG: hypothetical protein ABI881_12900 [Betaproteobacteria bacterium]